MRKFYLLRCFCAFACISSVISCKKDLLSSSSQKNISMNEEQGNNNQENAKRFYGTKVRMGDGQVRTFITISDEGKPQEIGIEMSKGATSNLPDDPEKGTYVLNLPAFAKDATPFNHVVIEWNAHGHAPFFYALPHFDFHFYMITPAQRLAIPSYAVNPTGFDNNPPAGYLPASFIAPPGGEEPEMGKHWVDKNAPELPWNGGAVFTKTFIYGTYDGKVNFFEPMITMAYLQSSESSSTPYPQPALFSKHGYYPEKYNVYKDNGNKTYNVSLSQFVRR